MMNGGHAPVLARLAAILLLVAVTISEQAAAQPGPGPEVQWLEGLSVLLEVGEQKLFSSDTSQLDVGGAVVLFTHIHQELTRSSQHYSNGPPLQSLGPHTHLSAAAAAQQATSIHRVQQQQEPHPPTHQHMQQHMQQQTPHHIGYLNSQPRQSRRALRRNRARVAALRQKLGRASYTLAALSASGLTTEYLLPLARMDAGEVAALCQQLSQAASGTAAGRLGLSSSSSLSSSDGRIADSGDASSSSSSSRCQAVVSSDPRLLQELQWLITAATAGTVDAQLALADRFLMGRGGLNTSCEHGLAWLQSAAAAVVHNAEMAGNWDLGPSFIRLRERFIDMSSPQSYAEWDEEQMASELEAAAAFGSADSYAQRRLGYRKLLGRGVPQDRQAAYDSFQAAVEGSNDGYALYNLGYMHLKGWVVPRDPNQALQYFKRALERGVGPAANAIGVLATQGDGVGVDYRAAAGWFEKGANMSDPDSMYNLGTLYLHGRGVRKDAGSALTYYSMAYDLGHWKASYALGQLYAGDPAGLGHNCEYSEKYFWQFVSQRSGWVPAAQAALQDYDSPSTRPPPTPSATAPAADADAADAVASQQAAGGGAGGNVAASSGSRSGAAADTNGANAGVDKDTESDTGPGPPAPCSASDRHTQALLRFLLLAEAGCEAAAENAAWMLLHGQGAGGPQALDLAAHLLYRSSMLNHTSSMVELARLLLNESIVTHTQQLQQAVTHLSTPQQPHNKDPVPQALAITQSMKTAQLGSQPAAGSGSGSNLGSAEEAKPSLVTSLNVSVTLAPLHQLLLQQPSAFMPPVGGPTACTGMYRRGEPDLLQSVSNTSHLVEGSSLASLFEDRHRHVPHRAAGKRQQPSAAAAAAEGRDAVQTADGVTGAAGRLTGSAAGSMSVADAAQLAVWLARRAAVAWLVEASSVGDAEAASLLGWLWHDGVLQGTKAPQEALAVVSKAFSDQLHPGEQSALQLAHILISLEQYCRELLGPGPVAAVRSLLLSLRDAAVRFHGSHPVVIDMPNGLRCHVQQPGRWQAAHYSARTRPWLRALRRTFGSMASTFDELLSAQLQPPQASDGALNRVGSGELPRATGGVRGAAKAGWWEALGVNKVDKENLVLTCLLGALAGALWLHVRQQGHAARRAGVGGGVGGGVVGAGGGVGGGVVAEGGQGMPRTRVVRVARRHNYNPPSDGVGVGSGDGHPQQQQQQMQQQEQPPQQQQPEEQQRQQQQEQQLRQRVQRGEPQTNPQSDAYRQT